MSLSSRPRGLRVSANLGFLWNDRPLADAVRAAALAGFDGVECHDPGDAPVADVRTALAETGLPIVSLNTAMGDRAAGEFGLAALPDRESEARAAIDRAIGWAQALGCSNIHVTAGCAGEASGARETFLDNLGYAASRAADHGISILIEPINARDVPGYFLQTLEEAVAIVAEARCANLRIMADCYHLQIMGGDLERRLTSNLPLIGHVQIAAVPSRAEPDEGEVAFERLLVALQQADYAGWVGAEYRPRGTVEDGLGWLESFRRSGALKPR